MRTIILRNGVEMSMEGFGVFQITDLDQCRQAVKDALPMINQKEMIEKLTKTAAEVAGEPEEAFIVLLKELKLENVGFGGHQVGGQDKKD